MYDQKYYYSSIYSKVYYIIFTLGGYSLKKFNLDRNGAIKMYLICQSLILPFYLGFLLNCPTPNIIGLNTPYSGDSVIKPDSKCNIGCECISPSDMSRSYEGNSLFNIHTGS